MKSQPITLERQRELIDRLSQLAVRRVGEAAQIAERERIETAQARRQYERLRDEAISEFERRHAALIAEYKTAQEAVLVDYETQGTRLAAEEAKLYAHAAQELADALADAKTLRQHRNQEVLRAFREHKVVPKNEYAAFKQRSLASTAEIDGLVAKAQGIVRRRCPWMDDTPPSPPPPPGLSRQEYLEQYSAALNRAFERLVALQNQPAARFIEDGWPLLIFLAMLPIAGYPSWLLLRSVHWIAVVVATIVSALVASIVARFVARPFARQQTLRILPEFQLAIAESRTMLAAAVAAAKAAGEQAYRKLVERRDHDLADAKDEFKQVRKQQKARHLARTTKAEEEFSSRRAAIEDKYEQRLSQVEQRYPGEIDGLEHNFLSKIDALRSGLHDQVLADRQERDRSQQSLASQWSAGLAEFQAAVAGMNESCDRHFAPWESIDGNAWQPAAAAPAESNNGHPAPPVISNLRFGRFDFSLPAAAVHSADESAASDQLAFQLPAILSFPECPSLLLEAEGEGRDAATRVLQNVMLRLLTTFPPGKVRFTIIDPVGLGQNFSAFMHLADYDDKLVNSRIWTEGGHINQRLTDLTEHMENVIQKYLRNEFVSIQEYNQHAGEVAEPFQILVIANFPANVSEDAARRLASIAASGARCGVYTLISTDTKLALPRNFDLADLEAQAATLVWDADAKNFRWKHNDLADLPLTLEEPPDDERFTGIIRAVGRLAKDASRVEVPFEMVTPAADAWWTADSRGGIEAPLGRAGAKQLQYLRLGKGTSQHVLISGKTGSGKSTLLNAMITTLALHYSPEELEFYLIDFKKGVEFKAYAKAKLPHARVIAIESEREFGMSVLEKLDQELKRRGDLLRKAGVQDVKGYRNAVPSTGDTPVTHPLMPRVLLIIDEFQEFFTSDDRIAHDAALLLDRLVRQGRAFGIHVLLGSQTLAGAYSLARSTLGQMAVRIALQCSEADAHLILSEDNTAARLLNRPGEAIYNDANGLMEGNHPFQIVWLPDEVREHYLQRLAAVAAERHIAVPPPIVFEGNAAAELAENELLRQTIQNPPPAPRPVALRAWLGAAVAIKDPTDAVFRPQGGSNLLVVGQQDELALGILASSMLSLAAQLGPIGGPASLVPRGADSAAPLPRFFILDGTRPDAPEAGFWNRFVEQIPTGASVLPLRDGAKAVGEVGDEVNRRLAAGEHAAEPIFLVIYNLARFRDLKKGDDYSFDDDGGANAGKQLTTVLREGPSVGVHTLVWCDSYNNVNRWLDRQALRDFEMRVLFQMSATDSSNLMDSPAASRLGGHTAMFYSEERGQAEKFRPYGPPSSEWLAWVTSQLKERSLPERVTP